MKRRAFGWPEIAPLPGGRAPGSLMTRLACLVGIWTASVLALLAIAQLIRLVLRP